MATIYDFASAGVGSFTFEPIVNFASPETNNLNRTLKFATATASANSVAVEVISNVNGKATRKKRAVASCSDANKKAFIMAS